VRVVAGDLGGRRLQAAAGAATRPTSERARAGLFAWLGARVVEARVLDLFAGSGALGIEAISRGAVHATFVEQGGRERAILRGNLAALDLDERTRVLGGDALRAITSLARRGERFGLVLADPPYAAGWVARLFGRRDLPALLEPGGVLVVERSVREPAAAIPESLALRGERAYGETHFDWFERAEERPA
jgi:16S rRNA (guanine966-N2)-methyltransferase